MSDDWVRVSRDRRCPICDHGDWCLISRDGTAVICPRVASDKRIGEAGWLHRLEDSGTWAPYHWRPRRMVLRRKKVPLADLAALSRRFQARAELGNELHELAKGLCLTVDSLRRFGVGWSFRETCWTWPMCDHKGRVVGITRRFRDGLKRIMAGHRAGLYLPADLPPHMLEGKLLITEGASDAVAGMDLGFWTVGRFSCAHGAKLLARLVKTRRVKQVVVVADSDPHGAGHRGAEAFASALLPYVACLKVVEPPTPHKDLRQWVQAGGAFEDVHHLIESVLPLRLTVKVRWP